MPRQTSRSFHRIIAKYDPTGEYDRILVRKDAFKDAGKVKRNHYKPPAGVYHRHVNQRRVLEGIIEAYIRKRENEKWHQQQQQQTLIERLDPPPPPSPSLLERIEVPPPEHKPVPQNIKFRKTSILHRVQDYTKLFEATTERLNPVIRKMDYLEQTEGQDFSDIKEWVGRIDELYQNLESYAHDYKLTHKQWRMIKRDLKAIGGVSFHKLTDRFSEICQDLRNLGNLFLFINV